MESGLLDTLDDGLAECAGILNQCEIALVGVSHGATISPDVLREQAAAAKAAQLLIGRLRSTLAESQRAARAR